MASLGDIGRAQQELVEAARQSSAQTRATDLKGYGREAQTLVSAERLVGRLKGFEATTREMATRLQIQDVALGRAAEAVNKLKQELFQNLGLESGEGVRSQLEEAFSVAKRAFLDWKIRVRSTVVVTHRGPETFEEAVQHYINRNVDLYDMPRMVSVGYLASNISQQYIYIYIFMFYSSNFTLSKMNKRMFLFH